MLDLSFLGKIIALRMTYQQAAASVPPYKGSRNLFVVVVFTVLTVTLFIKGITNFKPATHGYYFMIR